MKGENVSAGASVEVGCSENADTALGINEDNPQLIYVFYEAFDHISEEGKTDFYTFCQMMEDEIRPYEGNAYTFEIADQDRLGVDGWTEQVGTLISM